MSEALSAKQQIIQQVKDVTNILVTVNNNPSVDELSAALGLTLFLNKLGKHATAVASGVMPPAITFLEPTKTFEETPDSLRDFIIALDKEKADHLRYKVDGDMVKIFITPYKTTLSSNDLEFSQGDYNVELVLALNVADADDMDKALAAHGKILHDATVATLTSGKVTSSLGSIDWRQTTASGVSEMVTELLDGLKTPKVVLDEQIATALLTGVVAATERFSNGQTSSKVMTAAAELMAAGANQQLIATRLEDATTEAVSVAQPVSDATDEARKDGSHVMAEGQSTKLSDTAPVAADPTNLTIPRESSDAVAAVTETTPEPTSSAIEAADPVVDGTLPIGHGREGGVDEVARQVQAEAQDAAARAAEEKLRQLTPPADESATEGATPAMSPALQEDLQRATAEITGQPVGAPSAAVPTLEPSIGGTLNATTSQAAEDKRRDQEREQNRTILTHGSPLGSAAQSSFGDTPLNAAMVPADEPPAVDIFAGAPASSVLPPVATGMPTVPPAPTLAELEAGTTHAPQLPPPPLMPDFSTLPPVPPAPVGAALQNVPPLGTVAPADFNPNQFQIPGQQ